MRNGEMTDVATIRFGPELDIYPLSELEAEHPLVWGESTPTGRVVDFPTSNVTVYSPIVPEAHRLVHDAVRHIRTLGFLEIDEADDRMVDALVARHTKDMKVTPFNRKP